MKKYLTLPIEACYNAAMNAKSPYETPTIQLSKADLPKKTTPRPTTPLQQPFVKAEIRMEMTPDGQVKAKVSHCSFDLLLRMTIPVLVEKARAIFATACEDKSHPLSETQKDGLKKFMYDTMNIAFANALTMFAPEIEARPDLTADALLRAQNELLEEEMARAASADSDPTPGGAGYGEETMGHAVT